jgi:hypothetical protein
VNIKNASLLNFEEPRRKITKAKKKVGGGKWVSKESAVVASIVGDYIRVKEESRFN